MPEIKEISTRQDNITEVIRLENEDAEVFDKYNSRDLTPVEEQSLKDCLEVYRRNQNH